MLLPCLRVVRSRPWLGQFVAGSLWLFPVIESVHLLALALLGGARPHRRLAAARPRVARGRDRAKLARDARPWMTLARWSVLILTGMPLFLSEAVKCYYSPAFWMKMTTLPIALLFTFTVRGSGRRRAERSTRAAQQLVGALSIALWFTVAAAGRWIGFS